MSKVDYNNLNMVILTWDIQYNGFYMSQYNPRRKSYLYTPARHLPFRLSRSKIDLFFKLSALFLF